MKRQKRVTVLFMMSVMMAVAGSAPAFGRGGEHPFLDALRAKRAGSSGGSTGTTQDPVMSTEPVLQAGDSVGGGGGKDQFGGRDIIMHIPKNLPPAGQRSMIVAMHGGGGNARHMQAHWKMDEAADKHGFIVAYLNGTQAASMMPASMRSWNAGKCCAMAADKKVDDVGYISQAASYLVKKYGIAPGKIFVTGHSNGGLMAQRMLCETNVFSAGASLAGPLDFAITSCPAARGKRILAIHGELDANVPVAGGKGTKGPEKIRTGIVFRAEAEAQALFEAAGASYTIDIIPDTDHALDHLEKAIGQSADISIGDKEARFFGIAR